MRHIFIPIAIFLFLLSCVGNTASAQSRIGYVDIDYILKNLPEAQEAQRKLDQLVDTWQKELSKLEKEWQNKFEDYDKRKLILTDAGRAAAEKELRELDQKILNFRDQKFGQDGELFKKEDELMKPIQDKVFAMVDEIAKAEDYDYILDKSGGVIILYAKDKYDLTQKVLDRLLKK